MENRLVAAAVEPPAFARGAVNLADPRLGTRVVAVSDEFFAEAPRMLNPAPAVFYPDRYDDHGKWMDGWESRRRRDTGHDWCVLALGVPGVIEGVDFDTSFFTGNYPPAASLEGCRLEAGEPDESTRWEPIVAPVSLDGDSHRFVEVHDERVWTHLRVNILPDGGLARLRVYGRAVPDRTALTGRDDVDLAALGHGGRAVACSDAHFGEPLNLLAPGRGVNMGDGWETRRRREPGNDWCIIALGQPGEIRSVEVDTAHFKGNFPAACSIQAALVDQGTDASLIPQSLFWPVLLPEQPLTADAVHEFDLSLLAALGTVSHVRFNIIPDGGVSRLRLRGRPRQGDEG